MISIIHFQMYIIPYNSFSHISLWNNPIAAISYSYLLVSNNSQTNTFVFNYYNDAK